jgi:hypothetical protein
MPGLDSSFMVRSYRLMGEYGEHSDWPARLVRLPASGSVVCEAAGINGHRTLRCVELAGVAGGAKARATGRAGSGKRQSWRARALLRSMTNSRRSFAGCGSSRSS